MDHFVSTPQVLSEELLDTDVAKKFSALAPIEAG